MNRSLQCRFGLLYALVLVSCGTYPSSPPVHALATGEQSIIHGERISSAEFPATGALIMMTAGEHPLTSYCTATLITPDAILTAAHCMLSETDTWYAFSFADDIRDLTRSTWPPPGSFIIRSTLPDLRYEPAEYGGLGAQHDIAVAFLDQPVFEIEPAPLLRPEEFSQIYTGAEIDIVGYGRHYPVEIPGGSEEKYYATSLVGQVGAEEIQIGTDASSPQPCYGDSGGPAFLQTTRGTVLAGIISRAYEGKLCDSGSVNTRVDSAYNWISAVINNNCSQGQYSCYPLR